MPIEVPIYLTLSILVYFLVEESIIFYDNIIVFIFTTAKFNCFFPLDTPRNDVGLSGQTREGDSNKFLERIRGQMTPLAKIADQKRQYEPVNNRSEKREEEEAVEAKPIEQKELLTSLPKLISPINSDTLSVLSNTKSFLVLPNNTDKVGHYFEAPSEEIRNE